MSLVKSASLSRDLIRALKHRNYEIVDGGTIFMPSQALMIAGRYRHWHNGQDERIDDNLIVDEGLNLMLDVNFNDAAQVTAWYIALYSGNVAPVNTWDAANFTANSTEATNYTQSTRVAWTSNGASAGGVVSNSTSPAVFTAGSGGVTIWGAGLLSVATKSATTGKLQSAAQFGASRPLLAGDNLTIDYQVTLTST